MNWLIAAGCMALAFAFLFGLHHPLVTQFQGRYPDVEDDVKRRKEPRWADRD